MPRLQRRIKVRPRPQLPPLHYSKRDRRHALLLRHPLPVPILLQARIKRSRKHAHPPHRFCPLPKIKLPPHLHIPPPVLVFRPQPHPRVLPPRPKQPRGHAHHPRVPTALDSDLRRAVVLRLIALPVCRHHHRIHRLRQQVRRLPVLERHLRELSSALQVVSKRVVRRGQRQLPIRLLSLYRVLLGPHAGLPADRHSPQHHPDRRPTASNRDFRHHDSSDST